MKRFKNILLICDEQTAFEPALERATWLAKSNEARVMLLDVLDTGASDLARLFTQLTGSQGEFMADEVRSIRTDRLEERARPLRDHGIKVATKLVSGTSFLEIIKLVIAEKHDLVLKGAQRSTISPLFCGLDMHLMRQCPCPVWVLKSAFKPKSQRILVAVEPDPEDARRDDLNHTILQLATSLARQDDATLDVVHVWHLYEEATLRHSLANAPAYRLDRLIKAQEAQSKARLDALMADFTEFDDLMRVQHIKGLPGDVIPEFVAREGIDTVVVGTLASSGVAGLFIGNTAETILNHVNASVLTAKARGFISPVTLAQKTKEKET
ncbi:MAG: universal stress protein [Pseudomonadota bacterium]